MTDIRGMTRATMVAALLSSGLGALAQGVGTPAPRTGSAAPPAASTLSLSDRNFVQHAAQGGKAEIELGKLARQRAADSQVKAFGERMVVDHGKANAELVQLVSSKGLKLPAQPSQGDEMDAERLRKLSGIEFDMAYMKHMIDDHKKDVAAFEKAAQSAEDGEVRAFAARTLPTLRAHLLQAQTTYDTLRKQPAPDVLPKAWR
jgi:putative membrane protein